MITIQWPSDSCQCQNVMSPRESQRFGGRETQPKEFTKLSNYQLQSLVKVL